MTDYSGRAAADWANECVRACYLGEPDGDAIHLLGPLAGKALRISPPLVISEKDATDSLELLYCILARLAESLGTQSAQSRPEPLAAMGR